MIKLYRSEKPDKKFKVKVGNRIIHFGSRGISDYTINKDPATQRQRRNRKRLYLKRHDPRGQVKARENWSKSGIQTAGFWSRWLLWNKPSLDESIRDIEKRFRVKITFRRNAFLP
jgi:hypothetical protein